MNERFLIYLYIYQMMNDTDASPAAVSLSNKQINERILICLYIYQMMNSTDASAAAASLSNKQTNKRTNIMHVFV